MAYLYILLQDFWNPDDLSMEEKINEELYTEDEKEINANMT